MKKKIIFGGIALLAIISIAYLAWFATKPVSKLRAINLIPENAIYLIETTEPIKNWQFLRNSELWKHLKTNAFFAELTESANFLDTLVQENQTIFEMLGSRQLMVSAHMYSRKDYDFLFLVDLDQASQLGGWETMLKSVAGDTYTITSRKYKSYQLLELKDKQTNQILYLSIVENLLVGSYTHLLVEKSLDQMELPELGRNLAFQQVNQVVEGKDMLRVYLNYSELDNYLNLYLEEPIQTLTDASKWLMFSGLQLKMDANSNISAKGVTNLNDSVSSYLKAMLQSGKGMVTIPKVAPKRTAFMLHLGFESFLDLYNNFNKIAEKDLPDYQSYQESIQKLEKFLKIDMKENMFGWIDDELAIIQTLPSKKGEPFELAVILKAKSAEKAATNLNFICEQVRKKTPVRFRSVAYKDHTISFISVKGFFKILLGKLFAGIEKPYYTIIDDYVVFSNHPQTLKGIIDDYMAKQTLSEETGFQEIRSEIANKSNVLLYAHTPLLYSSAMPSLTAETRELLQKNQPHLVCFSRMAFQLGKENDYFGTLLKVVYENPEVAAQRPEQIMNERMAQPADGVIGPSLFNETKLPDFYDDLVDVENISPDDLDAEKYVEKYDNGQIRFEVSLKEGKKHGAYREYHETGEIKVKGKFKNDQKDGTWKIYDLNGKLLEKQRYRNGSIQ